MRLRTTSILLLVLVILTGCGRRPDAKQQSLNSNNRLNLYFWVDDMSPQTIAGFEKATGIKVIVSYYDTNETLDAKMLTGGSGFDVVVPTGPFLQRQIRAGAFQPLDKAQLPNLTKQDPDMLKRVAINDPGNRYTAIYAWGMTSVVYDAKAVEAALPGVRIDSWHLLFDPAYAAKLSSCGINFIDAPASIVRLVRLYLGKDPNDLSPSALAEVESVLLAIRPYVRNIDSSNSTDSYANGDVCIGIDYGGTAYMSRQRALESRNGRDVRFLVPKEGAITWFDLFAIPRDAPHMQNAHRFINYMIDPQVAAANSAYTGNGNAVADVSKRDSPEMAQNPITYPIPETRKRLHVQPMDEPNQARAITRLWQKFKTGQ